MRNYRKCIWLVLAILYCNSDELGTLNRRNVSDVSTCRRHMQSKHRVSHLMFLPFPCALVFKLMYLLVVSGYLSKMDCRENDFEAKLPNDVKARADAKKKASEEQKSIDRFLKEIPKEERVIRYSHLTFKRAAIEWLIATDQVAILITLCSCHDSNIYSAD